MTSSSAQAVAAAPPQPPAEPASPDLDPEGVALWLERNPDFLETRPQLASLLRMPDAHGRGIPLLTWNLRQLEEGIVAKGQELDEAAEVIEHNRSIAVGTVETVLDLWRGKGGTAGVRKSLASGFRRRFGSTARLVEAKPGSPLDKVVKQLLAKAPVVFGTPAEIEEMAEVQRSLGANYQSFVLVRIPSKPKLALILAAKDQRFSRAAPRDDSILRLLVEAIELRLGGRARSGA